MRGYTPSLIPEFVMTTSLRFAAITALSAVAALFTIATSAIAPVGAQEMSPLDGRLKPGEIDVLAKGVSNCETIEEAYKRIRAHSNRPGLKQQPEEKLRRRAFGWSRKCVYEAYGVDSKRFRHTRDLVLQKDYNALLERRAGAKSTLGEFKGVVDGYHRVKIYTTTQPGDAFCDDEEWLQMSFVGDAMEKRPITREEMERFIASAYITSIGAARCVNQRPKKVTYVFTVGDKVVAERAFTPEYGYVMRKLTVNRDAAGAFGKEIGGDVLEAAYAAR